MPRKRKLGEYISKRKNGTYVAQIPIKGSFSREYRYAKTEEEIVRKRDKVLKE